MENVLTPGMLITSLGPSVIYQLVRRESSRDLGTTESRVKPVPLFSDTIMAMASVYF